MAARAPGPVGLLGVLSALVGAAACSDDPCEGLSFDPPPEPDPPGPNSAPTIIAGEWIGPGVLELQFSKPITSVGALDPKRFVILAWDVQAVDLGDTCYVQTRYRALSASYSYYYYATQDPIAAAWIGPEDDTRLRLRLSNTASQCPAATSSLGSGVMLTYTDGTATSGPGLLTEDGDPIADIGPAWAITALDGYLDNGVLPYLGRGFAGQLPTVDSLLDIPCP